ncbi:hypothetical protein JJQ72_16255 [Paenibacillus sp. F411]|nr:MULTISPECIES: DUF5665 domain-containing protein [Paenibacillus]MBO2945531.1 hypothetical protein [Paenibacillus sp. F411]
MSKANPYPMNAAAGSRTRNDSTRRESVSEEKPQQHAYEVDEHPFELRHEVKRLNTRLDKVADTLERADFKDIIENYMNPKRRLITNFTAGLARGLGLTVGTVVVLSLLGYLLSLFVDLPLIGDYIAQLQGYIDQAR